MQLDIAGLRGHGEPQVIASGAGQLHVLLWESAVARVPWADLAGEQRPILRSPHPCFAHVPRLAGVDQHFGELAQDPERGPGEAQVARAVLDEAQVQG